MLTEFDSGLHIFNMRWCKIDSYTFVYSLIERFLRLSFQIFFWFHLLIASFLLRKCLFVASVSNYCRVCLHVFSFHSGSSLLCFDACKNICSLRVHQTSSHSYNSILKSTTIPDIFQDKLNANWWALRVLFQSIYLLSILIGINALNIQIVWVTFVVH